MGNRDVIARDSSYMGVYNDVPAPEVDAEILVSYTRNPCPICKNISICDIKKTRSKQDAQLNLCQ